METTIERIAAKARQDKKMCFTSLAHHITVPHLQRNLKLIRANTAVGIDGQDVQTAREEFSTWSKDILLAIHRKGYKPPATRRVYIPKPGKTEKRPIAVPTVVDRVLQKTVADILSSIYEQDFLNCSYGGRPCRGAHHGVATLHEAISGRRVNWVLEADLKNFFGSLNQDWVERFLSLRVRDPRITTLIRRWLKAGVMEDGEWKATTEGTAQGGPISVLLSNLYLHYVLDLWIERIVKPRMKGEVYYLRYLDDFILCFQYHEDALRFRRVLPQRLAKFSLALEPNKTTLVEFGRFAEDAAARKGKRLATIYFLGFTIYCSKNRHGRFKIGHKTEKSRFKRSVAKMKVLLKRIQHEPVHEQAEAINRVLSGHYRYYGIAGNSLSLQRYHYLTERYWRKMLSSRSQKGKVNWDTFKKILKTFPLCKPKIYISYKDMPKLAQL